MLIYGAGVAGYSCWAGKFTPTPDMKTTIMGFLDDDQTKAQHALCSGPKFWAAVRTRKRLVRGFERARKPVSEIIIAMPSASGRQMQSATAYCRAAGIPFRTLPSIAELLDGKMSRQIREVSAERLAGPRAGDISTGEDRGGHRRRIGDGHRRSGSIGSELCRQFAQYGPRKLVIFDQAESEMFMLALDLRKRHPQSELGHRNRRHFSCLAGAQVDGPDMRSTSFSTRLPINMFL